MKKYILIIVALFVLTLTLLGCRNDSNEDGNTKPTSYNEQNQKPSSENNNSNDILDLDVDNEKTIETNLETNAESNLNTKTVEANEINESKMVIVLDPGHGGTLSSKKEPNAPGSKTMKLRNVSGANGINTKTPEPVVNLAVALKLEKYLTEAGYSVILTRTTADKTISNIERAEIGNENNADLVVRIHADGSSNSSISGASMLVPGNVGYAKDIYEISTQYGNCILDTLIEEVGMKNRGARVRKDITGFNWSKVPVVLVEMGFMSNPNEDKLLASESYQDKLALALYKGIDKALRK